MIDIRKRIFILIALMCCVPGVVLADEVQDMLKAAQQANREGQSRRAADLYLKALNTTSPGAASRETALRGLLASSQGLAGQKQFTQAVDGLSALLPVTRDNPLGPGFSAKVRGALDRLAFDLVLTQKTDLAIRALNELMTDGPGPPMRWALLARAHLEKGDLERATHTIKRGLKIHPDAPELLFVRASVAGAISELAVSRANYSRAEGMLRRSASDLEQAAVKEPLAPGIQRALGRIRSSLWTYYRATGQYQEAQSLLSSAEQAYARASHLDMNNPEIVLDLARLLQTAQDWNWAAEQYHIALRRYRRLAMHPGLGQAMRLAAEKNIELCREGLIACHQARAVRMARAGHYDRAVSLIRKTARDHKSYAVRAKKLIGKLELARREWTSRTRRLAKRTSDAQAQRSLGDLWMQVRKYEKAQQAYGRALALAQDEEERSAVAKLIYGAQKIADSASQFRTRIGQLTVHGELPAEMDATSLRASLEKAHAMTMGIFPHRLNGPLALKVFANRRQFLEQAGLDLGPEQHGLYAFGRVLTFAEPDRKRELWLDILVHELSHRYVDEMTYHRAPRWLSEGIAVWASQGWSKEHRARFKRQSQTLGLIPWSHLESRFMESWGDPQTQDALYRQSHQMVSWLVRRFGRERLMTMLAGLRQGKGLDGSAQLAYGMPVADLERRWATERKKKKRG